MQRSCFLAFFLIFFHCSAIAQSFVIADIQIEGIQRVDPSSIFGLLNVNVGDEISQEDVANIIRDIFASDFFENVEVLQNNNALIIRVEERPTITKINIEGNKMIPEDALLESMDGAGLSVGEIFKPSIMEGLQIALESQYVQQGRYGASINVEIEEQERNRIAINMTIDEGDPSKIVHINIVGNSLFSDEELLDLFELRTTHFTSFFKKDNQYAREKINGDLERLTSFYMDQGYINFEILSTQVSLTPNKDELYITINVSEGDVYTIKDISYAGDLVDSEGLLNIVMQITEGQIFSQQLVTISSEFMTQILGSRGYFFAEVEGVPIIDEESKTVDVTFFIVPGARTYVNRINFLGNTVTADEVLRREMRQMEGAPASSVALEQSKVRLERLGYFATVDYETEEVAGNADQIDVNFSVEEQNLGTITGNIGYAQVYGLTLGANLQMSNFLGTGKQVGIGINTSKFSTDYRFNFADPYYTIDGISRALSLSYTKSDYAELNLAAYSTNQISAGVTFGYPISETQRISFGLNYSNTQIEVGYGAVQEIKTSPSLIDGINHYAVSLPRVTAYTNSETNIVTPISNAVIASITDLPANAFRSTETGFIDREGDNFDDLTIQVGWSNTRLNQGVFATAGDSQSLSLQFAIPGSDLLFFRLRYDAEIYFPIYNDFRLHFSTILGYGDGYGNTSQLPFFRNFYAGGIGTLRGFESNSLGPRSTPPGRYITTRTALSSDDNGDLLASLDSTSTLAYVLKKATDANGDYLYDDTGQAVFEQVLSSSPLYRGTPDPFGGNIQAIGTAELLFPIPFIEDRSRLKSALFIDVGNVFSSYCTPTQVAANNCSNFSADEFRYSAGVSVSWFTGSFGMMTFSLAKPFNTSAIDEKEVFQFTMGTGF